MSTAIPDDVIDRLLGLQAGDPLDQLRRSRPTTRQQAQQSHLALFRPHPDSLAQFSLLERHAVAAYVAGLHQQPDAAAYYAAALLAQDAPAGWPQAIAQEVARGLAVGPVGRYPEGPLSVEDVPAPQHLPDPATAPLLGPRLTAALAHVHLLVVHPRDADAAALQRLLDAGWSTTGIVTLSQLVAFLAFQIRVVAGLRALAAHRTAHPAPRTEVQP